MADASWQPVRPLKPWPPLNPKPFDTRQSVFIPEASIADDQIRSVSIRKVQMLGAKVYNSGTQSIADDGSYHNLTWDTEKFDEGGFHSTSSNTARLTAPYQGVYLVSGYAEFAANATGLRRIQIQTNGSTSVMQAVNASVGGGTPTNLSVTTLVLLAAGDYLTLQARQNSGGALNVNGNEGNAFLSALFVGPV